MSEAIMPERSLEAFTDDDMERRIAELFGKMLLDTSMEDTDLKEAVNDGVDKNELLILGKMLLDTSMMDINVKEKVVDGVDKNNLLHLGKDDRPTALLRMLFVTTGLQEEAPDQSEAIPIGMTKLDKLLAGRYKLFIEKTIEDAEQKLLILSDSKRSILDISQDLFDHVQPQFGETNLMRSFKYVRQILPEDLRQTITLSQRLVMAMMTPDFKIEEIAAKSD